MTGKIVKQISIDKKNQFIELFDQSGIFSKWFMIAEKIHEDGAIESQSTVIGFIGDCMKWVPKIIKQHQNIINLLRRNWPKMQMIQFFALFH